MVTSGLYDSRSKSKRLATVCICTHLWSLGAKRCTNGVLSGSLPWHLQKNLVGQALALSIKISLIICHSPLTPPIHLAGLVSTYVAPEYLTLASTTSRVPDRRGLGAECLDGLPPFCRRSSPLLDFRLV